MNLGMGAMLHLLGGGSENDPSKYVGRKIKALALEDNRLKVTFGNGNKTEIKLQSGTMGSPVAKAAI